MGEAITKKVQKFFADTFSIPYYYLWKTFLGASHVGERTFFPTTEL